ncbi:MAG: YhjD/YihY/BrkB family envelope integrity protein, partial [Saprospiraceae bacterium]
LIANGVILAVMDRLSRYLPDMTLLLANALNTIISFVVITVLFAAIFKVLPDAKIKWSDVRSGAIFTACLFLLGRFLIGLYISTTATGSTFGAAGSLIVVLVWIYYTSVILYLGAEFTQVYAEYRGRHIEPAEFAVAVVQKEIEKDVEVLPKQHEDLPKEKKDPPKKKTK